MMKLSVGELAKLSHEALIAMVIIQKQHEAMNFCIDTSTVDLAGAGVFALVDIPISETMMLYTGAVITGCEYDSFTGDTSKYVVQCDRQRKYINATDDTASGMARFINTDLDPRKINAQMLVYDDCVIINALRKIKKGEEIFIDYGR
jgi:hypothetical protein